MTERDSSDHRNSSGTRRTPPMPICWKPAVGTAGILSMFFKNGPRRPIAQPSSTRRCKNFSKATDIPLRMQAREFAFSRRAPRSGRSMLPSTRISGNAFIRMPRSAADVRLSGAPGSGFAIFSACWPMECLRPRYLPTIRSPKPTIISLMWNNLHAPHEVSIIRTSSVRLTLHGSPPNGRCRPVLRNLHVLTPTNCRPS